MKTKISKILAIAMAAAMLACAGAGCGNNSSETKQSTDAKSSVSDTGSSENKPLTPIGSSNNTESSTESLEESIDESIDESSEEEEEEQVSVDPSEVLGCWEYGSGDDYVGLYFKDEKKCETRSGNGFTMERKWYIVENTGRIGLSNEIGADDYVKMRGGTIVSLDGSKVFNKVDALSVEDKTEEALKELLVGNVFENGSSTYVAYEFKDDGKVLITVDNYDPSEGKWTVENHRVVISGVASGKYMPMFIDGEFILRDTMLNRSYTKKA